MKNNNYVNYLVEEISPYLNSCKRQLINWYPWCDEALERAKNENKLLFINIGFSACHWCHEMAFECFENEAIANILNNHYISIKIDKEERPDLDKIYLSAIQLMTDNAGWPLNCFALPDGSPIFGGTYFTSEQFLDILESLKDTYNNAPEKVREVAEDLLPVLKKVDVITEKVNTYKFSENDIKLVLEAWKRKFDNINGGTQNPPKFPLPNSEEYLIWASYYLDDNEIKEHLLISLEKIGNGAIHDHIGGGFFRYTNDAAWKKPHFEKMLYDNAQLVSLYSKAYLYLRDERYRQIVKGILNFLLREMYFEEDGVFYCSIDSDTDGIEGEYYTWTKKELKTILKDDYEFCLDYFGGNFNENDSKKVALYITTDINTISKKYKMTVKEADIKIASIKSKLYKERNKRKYPIIDKKIIASWNAMCMIGFIHAYIAFRDENYLAVARKLANYIKKNLIYNEVNLYRCKTLKKSIPGFLDDYAFVIKAFINMFQVTVDYSYIEDAKKLTDFTIKSFYDNQSGMFYFTSNEQTCLFGRKMDFIDRAMPSACSEFAQDLFLLSLIYEDREYYNLSQQMLVNIKSHMAGAGPFISNWAKLLFYFIYQPIVIKFTKDKPSSKLIQKLGSGFLPNLILIPKLDNCINKNFDNDFEPFARIVDLERDIDLLDHTINFEEKAILEKNKKITN